MPLPEDVVADDPRYASEHPSHHNQIHAAINDLEALAGTLSDVETTAGSQGKVDTHALDTSAVHGISDTAQVPAKNVANTFTLDQTFNTNVKIKGPSPWFDVRAYGAVGNGSTDDFAAFDAALNAIRALDTPVGDHSKGAILFVPFGNYRLSATLRINRGLIMQGTGGGWYGGTVLKPDAGVTCIKIDNYFTSTDGGRGDWSSIRDLIIMPASKSGTAHGIEAKGRFEVRNVWINKCSGNGIDIQAGSPTNANLFRLDNLRIDECTGHGVYCDGQDTNAGVGTLVDASNNDGWGIYDSSFLGNHWFGCHAADNTLGAYKADSLVSGGSFIGCYSEGGQPASEISSGALVLGGAHGADFSPTVGGGAVLRGTEGLRLENVATNYAIMSTRTHYNPATPTFNYDRFRMMVDGKMLWGPGDSATLDVELRRSAADTLSTGTGDSLVVEGNLTAGTNNSFKAENANPADGETAILVRRNVGGSYSLVRVSMGAADTGGAGFKVLRVPN